MKPLSKPVLGFYASFRPLTRPGNVVPCLDPLEQQRTVSTARRHRRVLNIAPASSDGSAPTGSSGRSRTTPYALRPERDHILFNPPPSAPNVYHTPLKFLPSNDPRRKLSEEANAKGIETEAPVPYTQRLPPPTRRIDTVPKLYHLGVKEIEEIRQLRASNEREWSATKLAWKFKCSTQFIGMVAPASKHRIAKLALKRENVIKRWGPKKRHAWEDRLKRREMWSRDE